MRGNPRGRQRKAAWCRFFTLFRPKSALDETCSGRTDDVFGAVWARGGARPAAGALRRPGEQRVPAAHAGPGAAAGPRAGRGGGRRGAGADGVRDRGGAVQGGGAAARGPGAPRAGAALGQRRGQRVRAQHRAALQQRRLVHTDRTAPCWTSTLIQTCGHRDSQRRGPSTAWR